jgi:hypothetical protein
VPIRIDDDPFTVSRERWIFAEDNNVFPEIRIREHTRKEFLFF